MVPQYIRKTTSYFYPIQWPCRLPGLDAFPRRYGFRLCFQLCRWINESLSVLRFLGRLALYLCMGMALTCLSMSINISCMKPIIRGLFLISSMMHSSIGLLVLGVALLRYGVSMQTVSTPQMILPAVSHILFCRESVPNEHCIQSDDNQCEFLGRWCKPACLHT